MSNSFDTLSPLILAGALDVLREETVLARMVNTNFDGAAGKLGDNVRIMVPVSQTVDDVTPAAVPPNLNDKTVTSRVVVIDQWKKTKFHMTEIEEKKINAGDFVTGQIGECARALAYNLNAALFSHYYKVYGYAGTAGTNPFASTLSPVVDAKAVLDFQRCPEGNRQLAIGLTEEPAALKLDALQKYTNVGDHSNGVLRKGAIGNLFGFDVWRDRQRPTHTAGSPGGSPAVNGAHAAGVTSITVKSAGAAGTYLKGDIVLFNTSGTDGPGGGPQTYVVTANATMDSSGDGTISIDPPLVTALAGNETITLKATHKVNLAFDPMAFALVMRSPSGNIYGGDTYGRHAVMTDPKTGIPLMLSMLPGYHAVQWELSILYGTELIDPRRAARLAG